VVRHQGSQYSGSLFWIRLYDRHMLVHRHLRPAQVLREVLPAATVQLLHDAAVYRQLTVARLDNGQWCGFSP
jgi:hypothetical protein